MNVGLHSIMLFIGHWSDQPSLPAEGWKPGQWKPRRFLIASIPLPVVGNSEERLHVANDTFKIVLVVHP